MLDRERADEQLIRDVEVGPLGSDYRPVKLVTERGDTLCRYYEAPATHLGAVYVGGIGGDWDTPAKELYPKLCRDLLAESIASLRVRFRYPTELDEAVFDVMAGLEFLNGEGINRVALVGHSFGGAVVIRAAAQSGAARTVVTLSTQSYGASPVSKLALDCSILLIHGKADKVLPPSSSEHVYRLAHEPKRLVLYDGAGHSLNEAAKEVYQTVRDWIVTEMLIPLWK